MKIIVKDKSGSKSRIIRVAITEDMISETAKEVFETELTTEEIDKVLDIFEEELGGVEEVINSMLIEYFNNIDKLAIANNLNKVIEKGGENK